jgi:hypothetical protein
VIAAYRQIHRLPPQTAVNIEDTLPPRNSRAVAVAALRHPRPHRAGTGTGTGIRILVVRRVIARPNTTGGRIARTAHIAHAAEARVQVDLTGTTAAAPVPGGATAVQVEVGVHGVVIAGAKARHAVRGVAAPPENRRHGAELVSTLGSFSFEFPYSNEHLVDFGQVKRSRSRDLDKPPTRQETSKKVHFLVFVPLFFFVY